MFENFPYNHTAYKLLKKCSAKEDMYEWNQFRKNTNNEPINLRFTNLGDFYLAGANLSYVDIRGTDLANANFTGADVADADISLKFLWQIFISIMVLGLVAFIILNFIFNVSTKEATNFLSIVLTLFLFLFLTPIGVIASKSVNPAVALNKGIDTLAKILINYSLNQQAIAKAKNPTKCIGFNPKCLVPLT